MKKLPKISIVIPSYNKAKYIRETLSSIFSQNYPNLEVIVQDGGSTDGTINIIKEFAKKYPRNFKWVSKKDRGQIDAINKGLKKASGDIVAYINADDIYESGALLVVGEYIRKNPDTLWLAGKGKVINAEGREISKCVTKYKNFLLKLNKYTYLLIVNYLFQPSVYLSKKAYKKSGPFRGINSVVMEYNLWLELGREKMPDIIDEYLSNFRLSMDNISATQYKNVLKKDYNIVKKYTNNLLVLLLHLLNNFGRIALIKILRY